MYEIHTTSVVLLRFGALVIIFATLPFGFEGKRRTVQAQEALSRLNTIANAVICFENDRMGDLVSPKAGIHQAFSLAVAQTFWIGVVAAAIAAVAAAGMRELPLRKGFSPEQAALAIERLVRHGAQIGGQDVHRCVLLGRHESSRDVGPKA